MAIELITGRAGTAHIDSSDIGAYQAYTVGAGVYILHGMEATLTDANHVKVSAGEAMGEGRHFRVKGTGETVTIDNGQGGFKRIDVIAAHYTRNSSGIESVSLVCVKGTPTAGTPTQPAMPNAGKVLEEATDAYWPLYSVMIDGVAPQTPSYIGDSIADSGAKLLWVGNYLVSESSYGSPLSVSGIGKYKVLSFVFDNELRAMATVSPNGAVEASATRPYVGNDAYGYLIGFIGQGFAANVSENSISFSRSNYVEVSGRLSDVAYVRHSDAPTIKEIWGVA